MKMNMTRTVSSMWCTNLCSIFSLGHCTGYRAPSSQKEWTYSW